MTFLFLALRKFTQMLTDLVGKAAKTESCELQVFFTIFGAFCGVLVAGQRLHERA